MIAAAGSVTTQATTMRRAMAQRTADSFLAAPTPTMEPVMVCVVDTGMPSHVAPNSVVLLTVEGPLVRRGWPESADLSALLSHQAAEVEQAR